MLAGMSASTENTNGTNGTTVNGHPPAGMFEEAAPPPKKQLTLQEMKEKTRETRIVNRYRKSQIESQVLLEAFGAWGYDSQGFSDTADMFMRAQSQAGGGVPPAQPNDRRGGRRYPLWQNDTQRLRLLQASRILCATNDFAKGMLRNQTNFTIGKGYSYVAAPKDEKPFAPDPDADQATNEAKRKEFLIRKRGIAKIVEAVQRWIDDFCARNNWNTAAESNDVDEETGAVASGSSTKEREAHWRVSRDGEAIIRLFCQADGKVDVRFVGPECVWGFPAGKSEIDGWTFGMQHLVIVGEDEDGNETRIVDLERIVNYLVRPHALGLETTQGKGKDPTGEIVPAREIIHIKDPWEDAEVKRGTPMFAYDTFDALMRATNLQRNISITSAVQAATAEIWKHSIGTAASIQALANGPMSRNAQDGVNGGTVTEQRIRAGMIRRVPAGQEPVPDPATTQVPNYMQAAQGDLRQAGASESMPEYMISGDASNANFASTQEAGTPYVRSAESRMEHFKCAFLRLIWRVVRYAVKLQKLPEEALTLVSINVEGMEIHKNNEGELSQARTANLAAKVTSPQIEIAKLGNDVAQVKADWKEWDKDMAPAQPGGAPAPGQPGQPQPGQEQGQGDGSDDPLAGVPQADLSAEFQKQSQEPDHIPDPKRSLAAKQAWASRGHIADAAAPLQESLRSDGCSWVRVPGEVLALLGADAAQVNELQESLEAYEAVYLLEANFTGIDSHGHKWVNGKQVKRYPAKDKNAKTPLAPNPVATAVPVAPLLPVARRTTANTTVDAHAATMRTNAYNVHIKAAASTFAGMGVAAAEKTNLEYSRDLRTFAVSHGREFDAGIDRVEHSLRQAAHFCDDPATTATIFHKLAELTKLKEDVNRFRAAIIPEQAPDHFGKKGAASINARMAAAHLAGGGDVHSAVKLLMKKAGLAESTAKRYVRVAVKQRVEDAKANLALAAMAPQVARLASVKG